MAKFGYAFHAYRLSRAKKHGAGRASWQQALKMALCGYSVSNGGLSWHARLAYWLSIHAAPEIPPLESKHG